jgi:hypothetical protein
VGNWMSATGGRLCAPGGPVGRIRWPHGRTRWAGREHLLARMDATGGAAPVARADAERHLFLTWRLNGWIDHGRLRHLARQGGEALAGAWQPARRWGSGGCRVSIGPNVVRVGGGEAASRRGPMKRGGRHG